MTIPIIKVKVTPKPIIKGKGDVRFPGGYEAGPGIAIARANGRITTSVDFSGLERDDSTPLDGLYVGAWDSAEHLFKLVLAEWLKGEKGDPGPSSSGYLSDEVLTATDLDTVLTTGEYSVAASCTNQPSGTASGSGYLQVFATPTNTNYQAQIFITDSDEPPQVWVRSRRAATWDSWTRLLNAANNLSEVDPAASRTHLQVSVADTVLTGVDLDTITATGTYSTDNTCTNVPVAGYWYITVQAFVLSGAFCVQTAREVQTYPQQTYSRKLQAGVWGAWVRLSEGPLNATSYGVKGDGVTNNTIAMQAAHDTGRVVYYPAGSYNFSNITIAAGGIVGDGIGQTFLTTSDVGTGNAITYTGSSSFGATAGTPTFEHFFLQGSSLSKPSGAGLYFNATSGEVCYAYINDVYILNMPTSVEFVKGSSFTIMSTRFQNFWVAGLKVANVGNEDSGDSHVTNCTFNTGNGAGEGLSYKSSGGLKVTNSKFNGGNYGIALAYNGARNTGDLLVSNCSIEGMLVAGIAIGTPTSHTFTNIVINGNQIAICPMGIQIIGGNLIGDIVVNNNAVRFGGTVAGIVIDGVDRFNVTGNMISGAGSGVGVVYGTSNCTNGNISSNMITGVASGVTAATGSVRVVNN